jgi:hypothetical protein
MYSENITECIILTGGASMSEQPRYVELVTEAVRSIGGVVTNQEIKEWVLARRSDANPTTINCTILLCAVNVPSRVNYPENQKARAKIHPDYDTLYKVGRGEYELYAPKKHGYWGILRGENDKFQVVKIKGPSEEPTACVPSTDELRRAIRDAEWRIGSHIAGGGSIHDTHVNTLKRLIERHTMDLKDLEGVSRSTLTPREKQLLMEMFELAAKQLWEELPASTAGDEDRDDLEPIQQKEQEFWDLVKRIRT